MDYKTIISTAIGVILGGIITWLFSWYYANQADKKIDKTAKELMETIPKDAAKKIVNDNLVNAVLSASPLVFKILSKIVENSKSEDSDIAQK